MAEELAPKSRLALKTKVVPLLKTRCAEIVSCKFIFDVLNQKTNCGKRLFAFRFQAELE
jgi:hypothetical protein